MDLDDEELKATRMMNGADRNSRVRVNNDIEVNEYVRTNKGVIGKLISETLSYPEPSEWILKANNNKIVIVECNDYPVKHSKQLIDLIKVGDIVRIRTGLYSSFMEFIDNEECLLILKEQVKKFWTIEEILTKEQFEANCYKVGGE